MREGARATLRQSFRKSARVIAGRPPLLKHMRAFEFPRYIYHHSCKHGRAVIVRQRWAGRSVHQDAPQLNDVGVGLPRIVNEVGDSSRVMTSSS